MVRLLVEGQLPPAASECVSLFLILHRHDRRASNQASVIAQIGHGWHGYSKSILVLGSLAILLLVAFDGVMHALIPLRVMAFAAIHDHYAEEACQLTADPRNSRHPRSTDRELLVPVAKLNLAVVRRQWQEWGVDSLELALRYTPNVVVTTLGVLRKRRPEPYNRASTRAQRPGRRPQPADRTT